MDTTSHTFDVSWCDLLSDPTKLSETQDSDDVWWDSDDMWDIELDEKNTTAQVTKRGYDSLTLRGAVPLPPDARSTFRISIDDYGENEYMMIGLIPATAKPVLGNAPCEYGGWFIPVDPWRYRSILHSCGWVPMSGSDSICTVVPPLPPGSKLEITLSPRTCHVRFCDPLLTYANEYMVLRFKEHDDPYGTIPERHDPTLSGMSVYPAVGMRWSGGKVRFL
jgi:hypothetical protein